jgi:4-amino-4-deoxy-L-arabinose transferase-like glycosyltransferase
MSAVSRQTAPPSKRYELWLVIFLVTLLVARLIANAFARTDLVFDEAQYWSWSRDLDFGYFSKPPLIAWLIRGTTTLCGNSEACIRSFPPFLFTIASWFVFLTGRALYSERIGFWSAIVFVTLPVIAFLATAITTDVPLLFFWSVALYLWTILLKRKSTACAVLLGLTIGAGLLAKYAMIYFALGMVCQAIFSADAREALSSRRALIIALMALALIAPNLYWNYSHSFITFQHTANNAAWQRHVLHVSRFAQFLLYQLGLYGPVLFCVYLWIMPVAVRSPTDRRVVMLLSFSLPIFVLLTIQSLISRTHANWTAPVAPAASILVTAWLLERDRRILFWATIGTNALATLAMLVGPVLPPGVYPVKSNPFARTSGWKDVAASVRRQLDKDGYRAVAVDGRDLAAELIYYLRDSAVPLFVITSNDVPRNHFEMTRAYRIGAPEPVLFVSLRDQSRAAIGQFKSATFLGTETMSAGGTRGRTLHFYSLTGFAKMPASPNAPDESDPDE